MHYKRDTPIGCTSKVRCFFLFLVKYSMFHFQQFATQQLLFAQNSKINLQDFAKQTLVVHFQTLVAQNRDDLSCCFETLMCFRAVWTRSCANPPLLSPDHKRLFSINDINDFHSPLPAKTYKSWQIWGQSPSKVYEICILTHELWIMLSFSTMQMLLISLWFHILSRVLLLVIITYHFNINNRKDEAKCLTQFTDSENMEITAHLVQWPLEEVFGLHSWAQFCCKMWGGQLVGKPI